MVGSITLRWVPKKPYSTSSALASNPIAKQIIAQRNQGIPKEKIVENLLKQGYDILKIRKAFHTIKQIERANRRLDWRSPTAINQTARMIRNDIRSKRISYSLGMTILLRARNYLRTIVVNQRIDKRLAQISYEIQTTKKLFMSLFANPMMVRQYKTY